MGIPMIALPRNENPKEEELKREDESIVAAFRIIFDGYRRAQNRTRAIIKAYNDLESIALTLLNERREDRDVSPKQIKEKASSSNADTELTDVLMVDLTSDFDFGETVPPAKSLRSPSPIFGAPEESNKTKKSFEERSLPKLGEASKSSKLAVTKNQHGTKMENKVSEGNEENNALIGNKNDRNVTKSNDVEPHSSLNESRPCGKLSLTRASYKIEKHKGPGGKTSKQSILVFQPQTAKVNISCSEKMKSKSASHWANLFDEDYRVKKTSSSIESTATEDKNGGQLKNVIPETFDESVKADSKVVDKSAIQGERNPEKIIEESPVFESHSQINETARSLFEDDDLDDFELTQGILNTCVDAPAAIVVRPMSPSNFGKRRKIDVPNASTPKTTKTCHGQELIDETFFAPGEQHAMKNVAKPIDTKSPVAGCSKILTPKKTGDAIRAFKQKIVDNKPVKNNEIGDLDLMDSDWDVDISNEVWSPEKRPIENSFDVIPEKPKKSPKYAYKDKTERNKDKRSKLPGWDCRDCEMYYGTMNLPPAELKKRMDACSRHKFKYNPRYCTPKDFWNPEFPDTLDSSDWSDSDRPINKG